MTQRCDAVNELGVQCDLEFGHRFYHWAHKLAWMNADSPPHRLWWIGVEPLPPDTREDAISVRHGVGFCLENHHRHGECDLRHQHFGPHARPGKIWR